MTVSEYVAVKIIPYQELSGNYNFDMPTIGGEEIIPYQELSGNYNKAQHTLCVGVYYTIPRTIGQVSDFSNKKTNLRRVAEVCSWHAVRDSNP